MKCFALFFAFTLTYSISSAQTSSFIHIDQFGYLPGANKVAVISDPQIGYNSDQNYNPSSTMEVRNSSNDQVVYTGPVEAWNNGETHAGSGDKGWWFDFSSVTSSGDYYLLDPLTGEQTGVFTIAEDIYLDILKASTRMFYYNRCNAEKVEPFAEAAWNDGMNFNKPLQDFNCRYIFDTANASLEKDLSGGWFDAGDYNKYVTFAHSAVHNLLWAYIDNPNVFGDDWNIPESGNGIPDILDEVKWELDWLLKMNNNDGTTHIKMGSSNYSDNTDSPPSACSDQRFYGPVCSSASIAVASMFAHASQVFDDFPSMESYAELLQTRAEVTWNYLVPILNNEQFDLSCDNGEIVAGDADWDIETQKENAITAAIHLFDLSGDSQYSDYVDTHIDEAEPYNTSFWAAYKMALNDALILYSEIPGVEASIAANIKAGFTTDTQNNWNAYYGFNAIDLYRAYMPNWAYHWGSNSPKAGFGLINLLAKKAQVNPSMEDDFELKGLEQLHYFHGVNPLGMVHLSNMYEYGAEKSANEIYHTWFFDGTIWDNAQTSLHGPAPGFLTGGPNSSFSISSLSPPFGQPDQKSYLDWNTGFPESSWEITEPGIYYQAMYIRLLSNYVNADNYCSAEELIPAPQGLQMSDLGNAYRLSWTPVSGTIGCQIKGGFEGGNDPAMFIILEPNASEKIIQKNILNIGQAYQWKVRCGCSIGPPAEVGPFSEYFYFTHNGFLPEDKKVKSLEIYPNPAEDFIVIPESAKKMIKVYDLSGRLVANQRPDGNRLDVSNLESGYYILEMDSQKVKFNKL